MSKLTSRQMLKAHNTKLKVELMHLKNKALYTEISEDVRDSNFIVRASFCWCLLFNKL